MAEFAGRSGRGGGAELSLSDALALMNNKAELESLRKEWAEREKALDAKIALAGKAEDIVRLREEAEKDRDAAAADLAQATAMLNQARTDAEITIANARAAARGTADEAAATLKAAKDDAAEISRQALAQADATRAEAAANTRRASELDAYAAKLEERRAELDAVAEGQARKAKLVAEAAVALAG